MFKVSMKKKVLSGLERVKRVFLRSQSCFLIEVSRVKSFGAPSTVSKENDETKTDRKLSKTQKT